jgi:5-formyltetrahydrofolate cyclo-ligase
MTQDRATLRRELRQRRRALPAAARIAAAEALAARILALPFLPREGYVAGYWAMDGEIGLHVLQLRLPPGLVYCLPLLHGDQLRFAPWRAGDPLVTNRFGIPEPDLSPASGLRGEDLALAVMPLVGFDAAGQRLGMGGGWYDRSFAFRRERAAPPWLVGAGFAVQQVPALAAAEWDVVPDAICTDAASFLRPHADAPLETDPA